MASAFPVLENRAFRRKIQIKSRRDRNSTRLSRSFPCVMRDVHAKNRRKIRFLRGKLSSFPVLENRALRKFIINSPEFEKLRFFVGGALLLCLTSMQKIVKNSKSKTLKWEFMSARKIVHVPAEKSN